MAQMVATLIVARIVGPSVIGTLAYGLAFVSMFSFVADLGTGTAHIKLIASGESEEKCLGTYLRIKLFLILVFIALVLSAFAYVKFFSGSSFESKEHEIVIIIYLLILLVGQLTGIFSTTWAARTEQIKQDAPQMFQTLLYQLLRIVLAIIGYKAIGLALGNLAAAIITIPLYFFLGKNIRFGKFDKTLFKKYINISFPVVIIGICQVIIFSADKVYLQSQTNSFTLGNYSAAVGLAGFIKTIEGSVGLLLFPLFSNYVVNQNYDLINKSILKYERITVGFILPVIATLSIFSKTVISIFYGNKFIEATPVFSILIFSYFISMLLLPYGNLLFGLGKFRETAWVWVISAVFFLLTAFSLVSHSMLNLKGPGMAAALMLTNLVIFFSIIFVAKNKLKKELKIIPSIYLLIYSLVYFTGAALIFAAYQPSKVIYQITCGIITYILFQLLAYKFKLITKKDFELVKSIFNTKKLSDYLKSELKNHN